jgi:hypothetical protein
MEMYQANCESTGTREMKMKCEALQRTRLVRTDWYLRRPLLVKLEGTTQQWIGGERLRTLHFWSRWTLMIIA